jgi:PadR family transcriptional regulator, regulatory protein PadR
MEECMARTGHELSALEQQVLLAIWRLHRSARSAYGVSIRDEIKQITESEVSFGSIYAVLERLEDRGFVSSREGAATAVRGGRKKLLFTITGSGQSALDHAMKVLDALRAGTPLQGVVA